MIEEAPCAQAFMVNAGDGEQWTVFHPGAMGRAAPRDAAPVPAGVRVAVLGPDDPAATRALARALEGHGATVLFDPGQGLGNFEPGALRALSAQTDALLVNEGEWAALCAHTGEPPEATTEIAGTVVVTRGGRGASRLTAGAERRIAAVPARATHDATGCGDALRAGLAHALAHGAALADGVRLGCAVAAQKIGARGAQDDVLDLEAPGADDERCCGAPCPVPLGR